MDYFESIIKTLLESEGYWVRQSFKVNLTKQEKREIGKHSIPRPEIDLLAYKPESTHIIAFEVKSYFDSPGVRLEDLKKSYDTPEGRYKLFTSSKYRRIVFRRLERDLEALGMLHGEVKIKLALAAGNVYQKRSKEIKEFFESKNFLFWSPEDIRDKVNALAEKSYENEPSIITAKILKR